MKITSFNSVFEIRLEKLLSKIKKLRKDGGSKDDIKRCIKEAKKLRDLVSSGYNEIKIDIKTGGVIESNVTIVSVGESDGIITVRFKK